MAIFLATITGLVFWVVAWALGVKSFDALMVTMLIVLLAAASYMLVPYLPGKRDASGGPPPGA